MLNMRYGNGSHLRIALIAMVAGLVFFIATRPIWQPTLFVAHDYLHVARMSEAARGLAAGHIPLRWSQAFNFGYGMPLFNYYAPLPSLVGAVLILLSVPADWAYRLTIVLATVVTMTGSFYLGKNLSNRWGGLLLMALYTLAPYRALNLFVRGALSEVWGMAFYPWIGLGLLMIAKNSRRGVVWTSLGVAGLALSHNLSLLIFLPLIALWGFVLVVCLLFRNSPSQLQTQLNSKHTWYQWLHWSQAIKQGLVMIGSVVLGLGMSAFYWLPAVVEQKAVWVKAMTTSDYFDFHLHFLYLRQFVTYYWSYGGSGWGPNDDISFFLGYAVIAAVLISGVLLLVWLILKLWFRHRSSSTLRTKLGLIKHLAQTRIDRSHLLIWLTSLFLAGIAILMTTEKTVFIWETLPWWRFIQFPWRYLSAVSFFLAVFSVALTVLLTGKLRLLVVAVLIISSLLSGRIYFWPEKFLDSSDALYYSDPTRISEDLSETLVDYVPIDMPLESQPSSGLLDKNIAFDNLEVLLDRPQEKIFNINSRNDQDLIINIANFPGWQATNNGQAVELFVSENGLLQFPINQGEQRVSLRLTETPIRQLGNLISLIAITTLVGVILYDEMRCRQGCSGLPVILNRRRHPETNAE